MTTATIGEDGQTYSGMVDTGILQGSPTTNYSSSGTFDIQKFGSSNWGSVLIKASGLSNITGPVTVSSATLYFYVLDAGSGSNTWTAYRLLRNWVAAQTTWNEYSSGNSWGTAGATNATDRSSTASGTAVAGAVGWYGITGAQLATDVQNMINGSVSNYGWIVERTDGSNDSTYKSVDMSEGGVGHRPYLEVVYTAGGGGGSASNMLTLFC